jgi:hypothetical protein
MHFVESDDILMPLKSVGESPMKPLGTKSSLTTNGSEIAPPSFVSTGLTLPEELPPGMTVAGADEPGAEQATAPPQTAHAARRDRETIRDVLERVRVMTPSLSMKWAEAEAERLAGAVIPTECRRCRT